MPLKIIIIIIIIIISGTTVAPWRHLVLVGILEEFLYLNMFKSPESYNAVSWYLTKIIVFMKIKTLQLYI